MQKKKVFFHPFLGVTNMFVALWDFLKCISRVDPDCGSYKLLLNVALQLNEDLSIQIGIFSDVSPMSLEFDIYSLTQNSKTKQL